MALATKNPELIIEIKYNDRKSKSSLKKSQTNIENQATAHERRLKEIQQRTIIQSKSAQKTANLNKQTTEQKHLSTIRGMKTASRTKDLNSQKTFNTKALTQQKALATGMKASVAGMSAMFAPLLAMFAGTALFSAIGNAGDWLDDLGKKAAAYGMEVGKLQALQLAWVKGGVKEKGIFMILNKIMEERERALDGDLTSMIRLKTMGLDPYTQSVLEMADAVQKNIDAPISEIFTGKLLTNMRQLQLAASDIGVTFEELRESGGLITQEHYDNVAKYNDKMFQLGFLLKSKIGKAMAEVTESGESFADLLTRMVEDVDLQALAAGLNSILWILIKLGEAAYFVSKAFKTLTNPETYALGSVIRSLNNGMIAGSLYVRNMSKATSKALKLWIKLRAAHHGFAESRVAAWSIAPVSKYFGAITNQSRKASTSFIRITSLMNMSMGSAVRKWGTMGKIVNGAILPFRIISNEATSMANGLSRGVDKLSKWGKWTGRIARSFRFMVRHSVAISAGLAGWDFHKAYSSGLNLWDSLNVTMLKFIDDSTLGLIDLSKEIELIQAKVKQFNQDPIVLPDKQKTYFFNIKYRGLPIEEIEVLWKAHIKVRDANDALTRSFRATTKVIQDEVKAIQVSNVVDTMRIRVLKGMMKANKDNVELMKILTDLMDKATNGNYTAGLRDIEFHARQARDAINDLIATMSMKPITKIDTEDMFRGLGDAMKTVQGVDAPAGPDLRSDLERNFELYAEFHEKFQEDIMRTLQISQELNNFVVGVLDSGTALLQNELDLMARKIELEREFWQDRSAFMTEAGYKNTAYYVKQERLHKAKIKEMKATELEMQANLWDSEKEGNRTKTIMNMAQGIMAAWAAGPIVGAIMGAIVAAAGFTQLSSIASQENPYRVKRAHGGWIPGMGYGDSVGTSLTPGEFVVNRQSARENAQALENINAGGRLEGGKSLNISINIEGNLVSNEDWVKEELIPMIKTAIDEGHELN